MADNSYDSEEHLAYPESSEASAGRIEGYIARGRWRGEYSDRSNLVWGGWWDLNPRHPEPQSGATTN
jgi:hypothetical protein